jgi:hypothetical protein
VLYVSRCVGGVNGGHTLTAIPNHTITHAAHTGDTNIGRLDVIEDLHEVLLISD